MRAHTRLHYIYDHQQSDEFHIPLQVSCVCSFASYRVVQLYRCLHIPQNHKGWYIGASWNTGCQINLMNAKKPFLISVSPLMSHSSWPPVMNLLSNADRKHLWMLPYLAQKRRMHNCTLKEWIELNKYLSNFLRGSQWDQGHYPRLFTSYWGL